MKASSSFPDEALITPFNSSRVILLVICVMLFSTISYGQSWSGILAPNRAANWDKAGLPATFPDGETAPNPWTPPTRTQCVTSACNTVASGTVTAASINTALASAPRGTYVLIPAGTFALGGNVTMTSNVTLRGSGAASTKLTGGNIVVGSGGWSSATFLTANPARGATSITVASPPSAGRLAALEQCDDGYSATGGADWTGTRGCTVGSYSDNLGPWVCGHHPACTRQDTYDNWSRHQEQHVWISGVSGSTVSFADPLTLANWSTSRSAALAWFNGGIVGAGVEDLTLIGSVPFTGTYASWVKGLRLISSTASTLLSFHFDAHSLAINNYIADTGATPGYALLITWGSDSGNQGQSDFLFVNNIIDGGYAEGRGAQTNHVYAYNYWHTGNISGWAQNGEFQHNAGTSFILREGNQMGSSMDDNAHGTHNFNTWFRNYISCTDPIFPTTGGPGLQVSGWARFENAVGNVLGGGLCSNSGYGYMFDLNGPSGFTTDNTGLTKASFMRWGNYVVCSGGDSHCNTVSWDSTEVPTNLSSFGANSTPYQNSVPANHNLPASFYMTSMAAHANGGTGLNWWKTCTNWSAFPATCASYSTPPMPPIGPEVTGGQYLSGHAYNIPAALAWSGLPNDTSYPTSWGSYLKQFDERVYQTDSAISSGITPPSGLVALVQ